MTTGERPGLRARAERVVARVMALKPVRVMRLYSERHGPLLAAGLSSRVVFGVFGAIWVAFSITGLVVSGHDELREEVLGVIERAIPGLIDTGSGGAIDPDLLFSASVYGWTGALALVGTFWGALGALSSARDAVREIAQLPAPPVNPVLLILRDAGLAIGFGLAVLVSALLNLASTQALGLVLGWIGADPDSTVATVVARGVGLVLAYAFDAAMLAALYRVLAAVPIPARALWRGVLLTAVGLEALKILGSSLLAGASSNPLLASFAIIVGLLAWFGVACQLVLVGAAWVVVSARDQGAPLDPVGDRERAEQEARLRLELEERIRAEYEAQLPRAVRWLARRSRRRLES